MNRFRGKKKATKDEISAPRPSIDTQATQAEPSSGFNKMFSRTKKSQEEPKREVDLTSALPPSDDFRTSLLMTGLSARFSMLREQDDPNTKMGKASDDSVLFPKRQSRMDFAFGGGLHDIAEVESIKAPPFARFDSFYSSDDGASTAGSIMNRGKPSDGNNLFGGRQKIYKISASGNAKNGGLPGRALYENDVAESSFQRWRQEERERRSLEEDRQADTHLDFSQRRETNSTTSSVPSGARNSTAATSIASSQPAPSLKDWQPPSTASSNGQGPYLERTVTRTRRLYEQSLTQDLHDQQSSAVSRMDTLSKRSFGTRTPDLTPTIPSPDNSTFDRFAERRSIKGKASAPNLRSFSPPITSSSQAVSPAEPSAKFSTFEQKSPSFGASPPLSPPISETEDHPMLPIQPNDRGKATAMGVFTRPMQQYDDSKYAQLQRQLQQGRDTPTQRFRTESNASQPTTRSRSSSSVRRAQFEKSEQAPLKTEPTVQEEAHNHTFFDDEDAVPIPEQPTRAPPPPTPRMTLERPNDHDHPAFRQSAVPTPLAVSRNSDGPNTERTEYQESPEDSPTLGPPSGLSGMVRQHLRNVSTASSVYGAAPESEYDSQRPDETPDRPAQAQLDTNGWGLNEAEWNLSYGEESNASEAAVHEQPREAAFQSSPSRNVGTGEKTEKEQDDFARHLADGARRVREKLTSYADPDSGRSTPLATPYSETSRDTVPPRTNPLGLVRPKSSRSSLADRDRETEDLEYQKLMSQSRASEADESRRGDYTEDKPAAGSQSPPEKDDKMHAGLKAFRQARRELQRMKQIDVQQRRGPSSKASPTQENAPTQRSASHELNSSRSTSQTGSDRDRSGSEASNNGGGLSHGQLRPVAYGDFPESQGPAVVSRPGGVMRSPAPAPTGTPPAGPYRSGSSQSLNVQQRHRGSDQASPISPLSGSASPFSHGPSNGLGSTASTPNLYGTASAPPLPPINPRRKTTIRGGSSQYGDSEDSVNGSPRLPLSPAKQDERSNARGMPDDGMGPDQFRQRLRKVSPDVNGADSRSRGMRQSPPRRPGMPPPSRSNHSMTNGLPGGMI